MNDRTSALRRIYITRLWRGAIVTTVLGLLLASSLSAAPLFPDVADNHWAKDAVAALAAKGIVEGYPDGTFKGDRAATRYEVGMMVARLLAKMEEQHTTYATKAELEELRKLAEAYREELDAFGVRVTNLEEGVSLLDRRVTELERIRFYGRMQFVGAVQDVRGNATGIGTVANPGIDWSTGRLLIEGTGLSSVGVLGLNADLAKDKEGNTTVLAGAEFVAYTSQGTSAVDAYWGPAAPYTTNLWTGQGSATPGAQPDNHQPFTRMVLDNFWLHHKPTDTRVTLGSYVTRYLSPTVMNGAKNPNIHRPYWLPFYGADVAGTIAGVDSGWKYEVFYTILPEASTYGTHSHGGAVRYEFDEEKGYVGASYARTQNERIQDGVLQGAAAPLIPLPAVPFTGPGAPPVPVNTWLDTRTGTARASVGPQSENTFGIDFRYQIWKEPDLRILAEWSTSDYNPDRSNIFFNDTVNGDLFRVGLSAAPVEGLELGLEYMSVDATYDPFIAAYPISPAAPVFVPFGAYYPAYYQLHDYVNYPNNREGFNLYGSYTFNEKNTKVYASYKNHDQKDPSTPAQIQTVGNIEPLFPVLQAGGAQTGNLQGYTLGITHTFDVGLRLDASYNNYTIDRDAPIIDDVDLSQDVYRLGLEYPITEEVDLRAGYYFLDYSGHSGLLNTSFTQSIPNLGFDWHAAENTTVSVDWRYFDLDNDLAPAASYQGSQLLFNVQMDF